MTYVHPRKAHQKLRHPDPVPARVMFLVALSKSGKGQAACIDRGFIAEDFRRENANREIVRCDGPRMRVLMGFRYGGAS